MDRPAQRHLLRPHQRPNFVCGALFGLALATGALPGGGQLILTWALGGLALAAIRPARGSRFIRRATTTIADGVDDALLGAIG